MIFAIGKREAEEKTVSIRRLGSRDQTVMPLRDAIKLLKGEAVPPDLRKPEKASPEKQAAPVKAAAE